MPGVGVVGGGRVRGGGDGQPKVHLQQPGRGASTERPFPWSESSLGRDNLGS